MVYINCIEACSGCIIMRIIVSVSLQKIPPPLYNRKVVEEKDTLTIIRMLGQRACPAT